MTHCLYKIEEKRFAKIPLSNVVSLSRFVFVLKFTCFDIAVIINFDGSFRSYLPYQAYQGTVFSLKFCNRRDNIQSFRNSSRERRWNVFSLKNNLQPEMRLLHAFLNPKLVSAFSSYATASRVNIVGETTREPAWKESSKVTQEPRILRTRATSALQVDQRGGVATGQRGILFSSPLSLSLSLSLSCPFVASHSVLSTMTMA